MAATLNGKLMEDKLKYGWTTAKFAEYLEITPSEFLANLEETFSEKAFRGMKSRLDKNDKAFQRYQKQAKKRTLQKVTSSPIIEEATKEQIILEEPSGKESEVKAQVTLEDLLLKEEDLSKSICQSESSHNELIKQKHGLLSSLEKEKVQMEKIKAVIESHEQNIKAIISDLNDLNNSIAVSNDSLSEKRSALDSLHEQISALKKVTIFVYDNGEFEIDNYEKEVSDFYSTELFNKIINEDFAENLTLKQLKQLAKLKYLVDSFDENQSYEIVFDSSDLEEAFHKL